MKTKPTLFSLGATLVLFITFPTLLFGDGLSVVQLPSPAGTGATFSVNQPVQYRIGVGGGTVIALSKLRFILDGSFGTNVVEKVVVSDELGKRIGEGTPSQSTAEQIAFPVEVAVSPIIIADGGFRIMSASLVMRKGPENTIRLRLLEITGTDIGSGAIVGHFTPYLTASIEVPESRFALYAVGERNSVNGAVEMMSLRFTTETNTVYAIEASLDLRSWARVTGEFAGTGTEARFGTPTSPTAMRFYRLFRLQMPPVVSVPATTNIVVSTPPITNALPSGQYHFGGP